MNQSRHDQSRGGFRGGFTLVELLMVILIISMLISLLLNAVNAARLRALEASTQSQIEQLVMGLEKFKTTYGSYPPDPNWSDAEIMTFLRRAWPKYNFTNADVTKIQTLDEAEILVFWLGGRFDGVKMTGFNADPRANPYSVGSQRTEPLVQFDETRLLDGNGNGFPEYYPPNSRPQEAGAFVYFAARPNKSYCLLNTNNLPEYTDPRGVALGRAVPYQVPSTAGVKRFVKEDGFQIICPGIDVNYGGANPDRFFPAGQGYGPGDNDNLVSFAKGRLGDSQ
jgi:prepilin-type N-terminal cleavage/methylation domain-containing protein